MGTSGSVKRKTTMLSFTPLLLFCAPILSSPTGYSGVQPSSGNLHSSTPSVTCRTEYVTLWDTKYVETETEVCTTEYEKVCRTETERLCQPTTRQVCEVKYETQCKTLYKNVCVEQCKTEYDPYTETECTTLYKEDCEHRWEGQGNDKKWVAIPGTCKNNPYDDCKDVKKQKEREVAYPVCKDVPEQTCIKVPRKDCHNVADQVCTNQPLTKCQDVPHQVCKNIHKKVPTRVSRQHPKKVCDHQENPAILPATPPASLPTVVPEVPTTLPEIIDAKNVNQIKINLRSSDKLVFSS